MKSLTKGKPMKVILLFAVSLYIGQLFQLSYSLIEFLNGIVCGFGIIISTFLARNPILKEKRENINAPK